MTNSNPQSPNPSHPPPKYFREFIESPTIHIRCYSDEKQDTHNGNEQVDGSFVLPASMEMEMCPGSQESHVQLRDCEDNGNKKLNMHAIKVNVDEDRLRLFSEGPKNMTPVEHGVNEEEHKEIILNHNIYDDEFIIKSDEEDNAVITGMVLNICEDRKHDILGLEIGHRRIFSEGPKEARRRMHEDADEDIRPRFHSDAASDVGNEDSKMDHEDDGDVNSMENCNYDYGVIVDHKKKETVGSMVDELK